ncbi:hypothetical protein GGH92_009909, partial [Coemansia sp. RSA 2673]
YEQLVTIPQDCHSTQKQLNTGEPHSQLKSVQAGDNQPRNIAEQHNNDFRIQRHCACYMCRAPRQCTATCAVHAPAKGGSQAGDNQLNPVLSIPTPAKYQHPKPQFGSHHSHSASANVAVPANLKSSFNPEAGSAEANLNTSVARPARRDNETQYCTHHLQQIEDDNSSYSNSHVNERGAPSAHGDNNNGEAGTFIQVHYDHRDNSEYKGYEQRAQEPHHYVHHSGSGSYTSPVSQTSK